MTYSNTHTFLVFLMIFFALLIKSHISNEILRFRVASSKKIVRLESLPFFNHHVSFSKFLNFNAKVCFLPTWATMVANVRCSAVSQNIYVFQWNYHISIGDASRVTFSIFHRFLKMLLWWPPGQHFCGQGHFSFSCLNSRTWKSSSH